MYIIILCIYLPHPKVKIPPCCDKSTVCSRPQLTCCMDKPESIGVNFSCSVPSAASFASHLILSEVRTPTDMPSGDNNNRQF